MGLCSTEPASSAVSHRKGTLTRFLGWFSEQGLDSVTIKNASPKPHHFRYVIPGSEHDSEALCSQATSAATLHTEQVTPTPSGHSGFHDHAMFFLQGLLHMWAFFLARTLSGCLFAPLRPLLTNCFCSKASLGTRQPGRKPAHCPFTELSSSAPTHCAHLSPCPLTGDLL